METPARVITEVSAQVSPQRETELLEGYRALAQQPLPDGLLRSQLLTDGHGRWTIQTLWRDQAALKAMRDTPEPPAAPRLFRSVGAEPTLVIWQVASTLAPADTPEP